MFVLLIAARKVVARHGLRVGVLAVALGLSACGPVMTTGGGGGGAPGAVQVALLVPSGSGEASDELLSQNLENAARLAISDLDGVKVDLRVYSTGATADTAAATATQAVNDGARIILGPVYAQSANAVGAAVAGRGVNVLSFSNNADIAGRNVFILGPTFRNTADRLVRYAVAQGKSSIAVLHDQTPAGTAGFKAIQNAIAANGATMATEASYPFSQQGVIAAVPGIATAIKASGAQAVFFTSDTAGALPLVTQLLSENGIDPAMIQYIGLTRWDIPASTLALTGVQHGWFALPDPGTNQQFAARYTAAYGTGPLPIAGLAYDGIAAIGALVKAGQGDLSAAALTQPSGFVGVNGIFRLMPDGTDQRGLAIAQIVNNQVNVIDPAPRSFGGPGS